MVRKTVFTRDDIIAAGVQVVERDGLDALTARHLAEELGSSTAPVYSNFTTMEELGAAVKRAIATSLLEFTSRNFTANPFLNIGLGVLEFARQKPNLYAAIFMQHSDCCEVGPGVMSRLSERLAEIPELAALPAGERVLLLHQMGIFTHGLAVQICSGSAGDFTFEDLALLLADAGEAMTCHALSRPERTVEQLALMASLLAFNTMDEEQAHEN